MSSTGMSLNERFTVLSKQKQQQKPVTGMAPVRRGRSRSRSRQIVNEPMTGQRASQANLRLLNEFKKKHAVQQTALKLKRRSLRTATTGGANKRIGVKSLRLAPNGRPIRTNSLTRIATMRADLVANHQQSGRRTLRRTNSTNNVVKRLGARRPTVGGAAERVAMRQHRGRSAQRIGGGGGTVRQQWPQQQLQQQQYRGRSRSRSRGPAVNNGARTRSQSRGRAGSLNRGFAPGQARGRTPTRNRGRQLTRERSGGRVSVKDRLGVRPGAARNVNGAGGASRRGRRAVSNVRGVTNGRIQKRRGTNPNVNVAQKTVGAAGRTGRARGRSVVRNAVVAGATRRSRSRSRTRKGVAGALGGAGPSGRQQQGSGNVSGRRGSAGVRRGRSLQRRGNGNGAAAGAAAVGGARRGRPGRPVSNKNNKNNNGNKNGNKPRNNQQQQPRQQSQERRGRSRSRGRGRNVGGKNVRPDIKKEDLDTELDQYMATTKTDMDYLLK